MTFDSQQSDDPSGPTRPRLVSDASKRLFGPLLAGFAVDAIDLMTFGPVGLYTGLLIGGAVGYVLAPYLGFPRERWWMSSLLTGIYCTLPLTAFVPAATFAAVTAQLLSSSGRGTDAQAQDPELRPDGSIEAKYEVIEPNEDRD